MEGLNCGSERLLSEHRGRIGRGTRASECILLAAGNAKSTERLCVLEGSEDGFLIAEADLAQRGPGEVLGTRQSGASAYAALRYTKLPEDAALLEAARDEATALMTQPGGPSALPLRLWAAYAASALPQLDFTLFPGASLTAAASLSTASVGDEPISQES